jgi:dGTPase
MNRAKVKALINSLKLDKLSDNVEIPNELKNLFHESNIEEGINTELYQKLKGLNEGKIDNSKEALFLKCILENHHRYLAAICDYIAGMSDNYAKKEYKELYLVD